MAHAKGWIRAILVALLALTWVTAAADASTALAASSAITVTSPGDLTTVAGNEVFQHIDVTDPDQAYPLAYSATGLPGSLSINPTNGLITGMATLADVAASPYTVTVTVTDADPADGSASATFTWTIEYSTCTVSSPGNQTSMPGDAVSLPIPWFDTSSDTGPEFLASGLPGGLTIGASNGYIMGTITAADVPGSPYQVTVSISDDTGSPATAASSTTFTWTVGLPAITVTQPRNQTSPPNTAVSLQVNAWGQASGQTLTYAATGLPGGLDMNSSGLISGTTTKADIGAHAVTVTVTSPGSATGTATFTWLVEPNKITVSAPPLVQSRVGATVPGVKVVARDAASGQTLTFTASPLPAGLAINPATGVISGKPKSLNVDRTVVTVTDKTGSAGTAFIKWKVSGTIRIANPGTRTVYRGRQVSLPLTITDNAAHDKLTVKVSGLPAGMALKHGPLTLTGRPDATGSYQVTITVTGLDGGYAQLRFRITVKPEKKATSRG